MTEGTGLGVPLTEAECAAAFLWAHYRTLIFYPERDNPEDIALWEKSCAKARKLWPWLDGITSAYEVETLGDTILNLAKKKEGTDGSASSSE